MQAALDCGPVEIGRGEILERLQRKHERKLAGDDLEVGVAPAARDEPGRRKFRVRDGREAVA
jgi:hypothetical protein